MARNARTRMKAPGGAGPALADGTQVELRIVVDPADDVPVFYVNHMEATNTMNDFSLLCARLPPKLSEERRKEILSAGELRVRPDLILTFPTSLVPGIIRALTTQKQNFEKLIGQKIQEPGGEKNE